MAAPADLREVADLLNGAHHKGTKVLEYDSLLAP
jgi:hypothetical protein